MEDQLPEDVQKVRITSPERVFKRIKSGDQCFETKTHDPKAPVKIGDFLVIEEIGNNNKPTGRKITKKVSSLEVRSGIDIIGFIAPVGKTLYSLYLDNFTVSVGVDCRDVGSADDPLDMGWQILAGPFFTPAFLCPEVDVEKLLMGMSVNKWPSGRYSATFMLGVDYNEGPPHPIKLIDEVVFALAERYPDMTKRDLTPEDLIFTEVGLDGLMLGHALDIETGSRAAIVPLEDLEDVFLRPATEEEIKKSPEILSQEEMMRMMMEAEARGENVRELREALGSQELNPNSGLIQFVNSDE